MREGRLGGREARATEEGMERERHRKAKGRRGKRGWAQGRGGAGEGEGVSAAAIDRRRQKTNRSATRLQGTPAAAEEIARKGARRSTRKACPGAGFLYFWAESGF